MVFIKKDNKKYDNNINIKINIYIYNFLKNRLFKKKLYILFLFLKKMIKGLLEKIYYYKLFFIIKTF